MPGIAVLSIAYILSHFYRSFLAVLSPVLAAELHLSPAQMSNALGAWFLAFALSQFLVGILLDKIGPKWTTAGMFSICAGGGGLLFSWSQSYFEIMIAMVLLGIGCAPILMASVYIFKRSFEPRKLAYLMSVFMAVGLGGNILGSSPLAFAMEAVGWRGVMVGLSLTTIVLSVLIAVLVKDPPSIASNVRSGGYWDIMKLRELWFLLPLIFIAYAVAGGLRGLWVGSYFDLVHGLSTSEIGKVTLWMAIAMTVGVLAYGVVDRKFTARKKIVLIGTSIALAAELFWALNPALSPNSVTIILIIIGLFSLCYGLLMAQATANIPDHLTGRGVTLINFFNMGGVGVMQWLTGGVYQRTVDVNQPTAGFEAVLWVYIVCMGCALVIYSFSKDTEPSS